MKTNSALKIVLYLALVMLFAGCASVDWNSRIGSYTYDQAVMEFGPPDRQTKLTDGRLVAEWTTRYYTPGSTTVVGTGYYGYRGGATVIHNPPTYYERSLHLTFDTNHVLAAWSKN